MELIYALLIVIIICGLLGILYIYYYNKLQEYKLRIDQAESIIDDSLREKYDYITSCRDIIKNKVKKAKISFKDIDTLKTINISNFDLDRRLNDYIGIINNVKEDYKILKDNEEVNELLEKIKDNDEKITAAKTYYNNSITGSNELVRKFPSNVVARLHKMDIKPFFDGKDMNDSVIEDFKL